MGPFNFILGLLGYGTLFNDTLLAMDTRRSFGGMGPIKTGVWVGSMMHRRASKSSEIILNNFNDITLDSCAS